MERRGGGSIVTLTYLGSERVFSNYKVMGVAKAALEACVRYLAADLGPQGIRVNAISAGPIKTLAAAGISGLSAILQHYRDRAPLRRTVDTSEVADVAMFLLGPGSRAITAEVLMADAGITPRACNGARSISCSPGFGIRDSGLGLLVASGFSRKVWDLGLGFAIVASGFSRKIAGVTDVQSAAFIGTRPGLPSRARRSFPLVPAKQRDGGACCRFR